MPAWPSMGKAPPTYSTSAPPMVGAPARTGLNPMLRPSVGLARGSEAQLHLSSASPRGAHAEEQELAGSPGHKRAPRLAFCGPVRAHVYDSHNLKAHAAADLQQE